MKMNRTMIKEEDVTSESISDLFKSAFFKVSEIDESNQFTVGFDEIDVIVDIDDKRKWIRFWFLDRIDEKSYEEAIITANQVNEEKALVRFFVSKEEDSAYLVADYVMSYEMGVIPFQVVNMAKFFEKIGVDSAREILGYKD